MLHKNALPGNSPPPLLPVQTFCSFTHAFWSRGGMNHSTRTRYVFDFCKYFLVCSVPLGKLLFWEHPCVCRAAWKPVRSTCTRPAFSSNAEEDLGPAVPFPRTWGTRRP